MKILKGIKLLGSLVQSMGLILTLGSVAYQLIQSGTGNDALARSIIDPLTLKILFVTTCGAFVDKAVSFVELLNGLLTDHFRKDKDNNEIEITLHKFIKEAKKETVEEVSKELKEEFKEKMKQEIKKEVKQELKQTLNQDIEN